MPTGFVALAIVIYLLPGFLGYFLYEAIAESPRRDASDKIILAIAFTLFSATVSTYLFNLPIIPPYGEQQLQKDPKLLSAFIKEGFFAALASSCVLGVVLGWLRNKGWVFDILRCIGATTRTGQIDPWHQVFSTFNDRWILLAYKDGSQLVGWPEYRSEEGSKMMLFLKSACWSIPNGTGGLTEHQVVGEGILLTDFSSVLYIQIYKP